jgi:hypothetical protein
VSIYRVLRALGWSVVVSVNRKPSMRPRQLLSVVGAVCAVVGIMRTTVVAQLQERFFEATDDPAIGYATRPVTDRIAGLSARVQSGELNLTFESGRGYLRSLLAALNVPIESQLAVYSKTSLQASRISPQNPRAIYFNDSVVVAWPRGGFIEIAAQDPSQGVIFYLLEQREVAKPTFVRSVECLRCHNSYDTLNVPGMLVRSIATTSDGTGVRRLANYTTNDLSPFGERWAGWYVTGDTGAMAHLGNTIVSDVNIDDLVPSRARHYLMDLTAQFDTSLYLSPYSDVVALMVFDHQMYMTNLLTRVGWEVRVATAAARPDLAEIIRTTAEELVDDMLFVDEVPLPSPIRGTSGFAERFTAGGPVDGKGRSLRDLDLQTRLMRYPCSFMIYSDAFDRLPAGEKAAVYSRMWEILSGQEHRARYSRLSTAERQAIVEILRETKVDLPASLRPAQPPMSAIRIM